MIGNKVVTVRGKPEKTLERIEEEERAKARGKRLGAGDKPEMTKLQAQKEILRVRKAITTIDKTDTATAAIAAIAASQGLTLDVGQEINAEAKKAFIDAANKYIADLQAIVKGQDKGTKPAGTPNWRDYDS